MVALVGFPVCIWVPCISAIVYYVHERVSNRGLGPLGVSGEGASAPVWVTPSPATAVAAARFRAALSVGDTGDRSHLCRSTWCPRLWRLNLGACVCMHTWGGRLQQDECVRSRDARL